MAASFHTTVNPIVQNGAIPVFEDIDEVTYNINVHEIVSAIPEKTRKYRWDTPLEIYFMRIKY